MSRIISRRKALSMVLILIAIILLACLINNSKHTWKLFGFLLCEKPNSIVIHSTVNEGITNRIIIKGKSNNDKKVYSGYTYIIKEKEMYVGIKYKYIFTANDKKDFEIVIPYSKNEVNKVFIKNNSEERQVFPNNGN